MKASIGIDGAQKTHTDLRLFFLVFFIFCNLLTTLSPLHSPKLWLYRNLAPGRQPAWLDDFIVSMGY